MSSPTTTTTTSVLLESRPFRPFKSSEEYLYAMKEDLAEWLQTMYPHLNINVDNFMEKLETGVALCEHANAVKEQAAEYVEKKQAKKVMMRSATGSLGQAQLLITIPDVKYFITAKPGTFFARDNLSNFIKWCRYSLKILECLLFESDDLIMRKNEKHVILCLLEVARRGAKFGMLAPMLVQMERQIDREIAADQKKFGFNLDSSNNEPNSSNNNNNNNNGSNNNNTNDDDDDDDSDSEFEEEEPVMMYGPIPQIVTNDLKSLDEMVRDLVAQCTCPTQFPMIRVSEGKYRIGDTKVLIFVRILRKHVMVRVGGGWDTLAHYLDKHDPCRCRGQHRPTQGARLVPSGKASDLHGAQVYYDRSAASPASLPANLNGSSTAGTSGINGMHSLGPPMNTLNRSRSRSPSSYLYSGFDSRRSISPNPRKCLAPPTSNRSRSPTPNYISSHVTKLSTTANHKSSQHSSSIKMNSIVPPPPPPPPPLPSSSGPQSLPYIPTSPKSTNNKHVASIQINPNEHNKIMKSEAVLHVNNESQSSDNHSDTSSQMSDEGYRSLGIVIQDKNNKKRSSMYSQNSCEDVEENEHQPLDTEDELNDIGLRKTSFSKIIYENENGKLSRKSPIRSISVSPTTEETDSEKTVLNYQKPSQNLGSSTKKLKERSLSDDHRQSLHRTSSTDKVLMSSVRQGSPNSKRTSSSLSTTNSTPTTKKPDSKINNWSTPRSRGGCGGGFNARTNSTDLFVSPFQRNLAGRRSMSAVNDHHRKQSLSANTSPNHQCSLKRELLMAVKQANDDNQAVLHVQELLRKYGSTTTLNGDESYSGGSTTTTTTTTTSPLARHKERMSFRSPRKEIRQGNGTSNISRIPAPVLFKA